ncbi:MAG TPA: SMC-Scp complex subunit ScpB [Pyrinomonadaceae bacterium]|jgi:segregation and condensation protein B
MSEDIKDQEIAESAKPSAADDDASSEQLDEALLSFDEAEGEAETALEEDEGVIIHDADAEDALEEARLRRAFEAQRSHTDVTDEGGETETPHNVRGMAEMMAIIEALIFVAEEPLSVKALSDVLKEDRGWIETAVEGLAEEFNARNGGLYLREVAGGWQFATRPEHHEHVRAFLKTRPSAKLSLASLETLAVIAYKQPITVPEILEIRGVQSPSAIKTLLDKRLIVAKGRKETIGRPMMYGTSKEFLLQFGLKDLSELPNVEDFEDLAGGM